MSQENFNAPASYQVAANSRAPVIQIAGNSSGPINILQRPKLPISPIPHEDRVVATDVWAQTPTPQRAADLLAACGLAVIAGEPGTGRRISAIRALDTYLSPHVEEPRLCDVAADWDEDETPEHEVLPDPSPGHGYCIDVTSRTLSVSAAGSLIAWADALHQVGSCLVVIDNQGRWQGDSRFVVDAIRPNGIQVARNHLIKRFQSPVHAHWLQPDPERAGMRNGFMRSQPIHDPAAGVFSDLITRKVSPSSAVEISKRLSSIDVERLTKAIEQRDSKDGNISKRGRDEIKAIREEVLLWADFLEKILTETGTRGQDRTMLLSAAYLEGAPVELCINTAADFGPRDEQIKRRYREGRSPRRRLQDVGVDVTPDDRVAFDKHPGLAMPAIRADWHHWADERAATREWIQRITAPGGIADAWSGHIGKRLLDLSRTAVDPPFFAIVESWISSVSLDAGRIGVIADLLTRAAETKEVAQEANKKLLYWAARENLCQRQVVAQVCAGRYGLQWPHMALVRLRHILSIGDGAADIATEALVAYAHTEPGFKRVIEAVDSWLDKYRSHPAGPRAFLALIDPSRADRILNTLITLAQATPKIRDFLIVGWSRTLQLPEVRERAYEVLIGWAKSVHDGRLDRKFTFEILTDVRNAHTPLDALSRFLYGDPDQEDPALISARFALANLQACNHLDCPDLNCPVRYGSGTATGHTMPVGEGETE